jgi:hypothetical protein
MALKVEQDREVELIDIIKDTIDTENQRIASKLKFEDFQRLIDRGVPTKDILAEVKSRADGIFKAEHPEPKEPIMPVVEPAIEPISMVIEPVEETTYFAVYRITGSLGQLRGVSEFIKSKGITYKVVEQGEV